MPSPISPKALTLHLGPFTMALEPPFLVSSVIFGAFIGFLPESGPADKLIPSPAAAVAGILAVLLILLVHEFGHAFRFFLAGHRNILLRFHGILLSESHTAAPIPNALAWQVLLSGPLANAVLGGALLAIRARILGPEAASADASDMSFGLQLLTLTGRYSLAYGLLGLIPVPPLDAGLAALAVLTPERRQTFFKVTAVASFLAAALFLTRGVIIGCLLFGFVGWRNWKLKDLNLSDLAGQAAEEAPFIQMLNDGWKALHGGDIREAERLGTLCLKNSRGPNLSVGACDLLAWVDLARADVRQAAKHLDQGRTLSGGMFRALTQAMILEAQGKDRQALLFAVESLRKEPSLTSARLTLRLLKANGLFDEAQALIDTFDWPPNTDKAALLADLKQAKDAAAAQQAQQQPPEKSPDQPSPESPVSADAAEPPPSSQEDNRP